MEFKLSHALIILIALFVGSLMRFSGKEYCQKSKSQLVEWSTTIVKTAIIKIGDSVVTTHPTRFYKIIKR